MSPAEVETMFYNTEVPWHGLGTKLDNVATAEEALAAAQLDWEVKMVPIYTHNLQGRMTQIPDKMAVRRESDAAVLGILGPNFVPVQNREAFTFFDGVVGSGEAKYETAGSLDGGRRIWMLAKVDGIIDVKGDHIEKYLLLCNGHDGGMAIKMFFTPVRVVCQNTLEAALMRQSADRFYSRHTAGVMGRMDIAREILGITRKHFEDYGEMANFLASQPFDMAKVPQLMAATFEKPKLLPAKGSGRKNIDQLLEEAELDPRTENAIRSVCNLLHTGKGLDIPSIAGTKWAAFNAVVEYVDYGRNYGGREPANLRLKNVWFEGGARTKQRALNYLLKK